MLQQNNCGNGTMPLNVDCQNAASQIQGRGNSAAVAASQGAADGEHGRGHDDGHDRGTRSRWKGGDNHDGRGNSANGGNGGDANSGGMKAEVK